MIAGGPLASAILAVLCLAGLELYGNDRWSISGTLFWTSLLAAFGTAVPFSAGLQNSDGALLRMLFKDAEGTRQWLALVDLQTRDTRGERPRDWDQERIKEIMSAPSASNLYVVSQLLAFYYRLDQHADEAALGHLENLLASSGTMPVRLRHQIFLEAACSSAHIRHNPAHARAWRTRACKRHKPSRSLLPTRASRCTRGVTRRALQHWETEQARVVRRRLDSGIARFAKERWSAYQEECRNRTLASITLS